MQFFALFERFLLRFYCSSCNLKSILNNKVSCYILKSSSIFEVLVYGREVIQRSSYMKNPKILSAAKGLDFFFQVHWKANKGQSINFSVVLQERKIWKKELSRWKLPWKTNCWFESCTCRPLLVVFHVSFFERFVISRRKS